MEQGYRNKPTNVSGPSGSVSPIVRGQSQRLTPIVKGYNLFGSQGKLGISLAILVAEFDLKGAIVQ